MITSINAVVGSASDMNSSGLEEELYQNERINKFICKVDILLLPIGLNSSELVISLL